MKRRDFLKTSALGAAFVSTSGMYISCTKSGKSGSINCFQPNQDIPVIQQVDVFIAGGSTAAVNAAVRIAKNGGSVFLATDQPYLGEDICGTLNFWEIGTPGTELAKTLFPDGTVRNPIFYKRTLDNALLDNDIPFLFSSFVTDTLTDADGAVAGVVISNRSGRQAVLAKTIIDATQYATVARVMNVPFREFHAGEQEFAFTVVGNAPTKGLTCTHRKAPFALKNDPISVLEYKIKHKISQDRYSEYQQVEQQARDLTWDSNQMDSSDSLKFIPVNPVISAKSNTSSSFDAEKIEPGSFQPKDTAGLFLLNGYADLDRTAAAEFLKPCNAMAVAEKIAQSALSVAGQKSAKKPVSLIGAAQSVSQNGIEKAGYDFIRPTQIKDEISSQISELPVFGTFDVVVMGGGTAGAPAAIGAAEDGANTLLIEYLHGLGGIGTLGLIGAYFHGYREGYTAQVDKVVRQYGGKNHPRTIKAANSWVKDWKMEYYRSQIRQAGAEIWYGAIGVGALVDGNQVTGVVIATPFGKGVVLANKIIDSTGSADIAIAAGAKFRYTDKDCLAVQGAGLPPIFKDRSYNNTDWTFINDTDVFDVWRTFVSGKKKYDDGHYDIGKLPQTRERRRIIGDHEISVLDLYNNRTYPDTVSIHKSSFDTHGFTNDPFFNLKPPKEAHVDEIAFVPLRSLLPKDLENIIVTGLGASADRDAMPVIRMQPCLQNQGYTVGKLAALAVKENVSFRKVSLRQIQEKMVAIKSLPESVLTDTDNYPPTAEQTSKATRAAANGFDLLEIVLWDTPKGLKLVQEAFHNAKDVAAKQSYAHVLGTYGITDGWQELANAVQAVEKWDEGWRYRGMGQFGPCMSPLDSMIIALGTTGKKEALPVIFEKAKTLSPNQEFSHFRAIALALENFKSKEAAQVLYDLLQLKGVQGHDMSTIEKAKSFVDKNWENTEVRNNSLRELVLARALYRTGDKSGLGKSILEKYARDLKGHYARHAIDVLA